MAGCNRRAAAQYGDDVAHTDFAATHVYRLNLLLIQSSEGFTDCEETIQGLSQESLRQQLPK